MVTPTCAGSSCVKYEIRHVAVSASDREHVVDLRLQPSDLGRGIRKQACGDRATQRSHRLGDGIRINAVAPGFAHSEMIDPWAAGNPGAPPGRGTALFDEPPR